MSLEHFGFPCRNPREDEPESIRCPRCGALVYDGEDAFFDKDSDEIAGCENCITWAQLYLEEKEGQA